MTTQTNAVRALQTLRGFIGHNQLQEIYHAGYTDERQAIFDKMVEYEARIQAMPRTDEKPGNVDEAVAMLHYSKNGMHWYITEKSRGLEQYQAYGLADIGNRKPEIGYISIAELIEHDAKLDLDFVPKTFGKIKDILRAVGRLAMVATVAVSLAACASPVWEKPGATQAEWEQTKASCMIEAAQRVPVKEVFVPVAGSSFSSQSCDKHGRNCTEYSNYTPPTIEQVDANIPLRDQATRACLSRKGWTEVTP